MDQPVGTKRFVPNESGSLMSRANLQILEEIVAERDPEIGRKERVESPPKRYKLIGQFQPHDVINRLWRSLVNNDVILSDFE